MNDSTTHTLVALYKHYQNLPFSSTPKQPLEFFDALFHGAWAIGSILNDSDAVKTQQVEKNWIWPILVGLQMLRLPVMAHISAFSDYSTPGIWLHPERTLVQITTFPATVCAGIPIAIENNGEVVVTGLWSSGIETHTPYELLAPGQQQFSIENSRPEFWRDFFLNELERVRATAKKSDPKAMRRAEEIARAFSVRLC